MPSMRKFKRAIVDLLDSKAAVRRDDIAKIEADAFFDYLKKAFVLQGDHIGAIEYTIDHYAFHGGWMMDSFYFDVFDTDYGYSKRICRIYVGISLLKETEVRWYIPSFALGKDKESDFKLLNPEGITKEDFITVINAAVPDLIKTSA